MKTLIAATLLSGLALGSIAEANKTPAFTSKRAIPSIRKFKKEHGDALFKMGANSVGISKLGNQYALNIGLPKESATVRKNLLNYIKKERPNLPVKIQVIGTIRFL